MPVTDPPPIGGQSAASETVTRLLGAMRTGKGEALGELMDAVYDELRRVAHRRLQGERAGHTLSTTALVNETYLRLVDQRWASIRDRAHFFAIAATAMRRILVSYARQHNAGKRFGDAQKIPLDDLLNDAGFTADRTAELLALDDALNQLEAFNERGCRVVEYRVFAGLTHDEIAELLGVSTVTVRRAWSLAKMWLTKTL